MIVNYLKVAWRNLLKNKMHSVINVGGLAVGMTVAMMIGLFIWDEWSFNKSIPHYDKIGQVHMYQTFNNQRNPQNAVPLPLRNELSRFPDFKEIALTSWKSDHILANGENKFIKNGLYAEAAFARIMSLKMISGDQNGLAKVEGIMLSESLAKSLFGEEDAIDKIIKVDNRADLRVTGVYKDFASNTTFSDVTHLLSWQYYLNEKWWVKNLLNDWTNSGWQCYVRFADKANEQTVFSKIKDLVQKNLAGEARSRQSEVFVYPMSKWHLYSDVENGKYTGGRITYVRLFGIIGLFVLLLACINFMNLSTARSEKRAREIGIRKAVGSDRRQLIFQFLSESILTALLASILSVLLVFLTMPWFNELTRKDIQIPSSNVYFWMICFVFMAFTGMLAGIYPALYLSSFKVVSILKSALRVGQLAIMPRKILVVLQFTVSVILIAGTIVVYSQIQYAKSRPTGYNRSGLIAIQMNTPELYNANYESLRNELLQTGKVENMCKSNSPVTQVRSNDSRFDWEGKDPDAHPLFSMVSITEDYAQTIGMQIKEGRNFSRNFKTDTASLIINESAARIIGLKDPLNKYIRWNDEAHTPFKIVGIAKDIVTESPFMPVRPAFYFMQKGWYEFYIIKLKQGINTSEALQSIETIFKKINPGGPFAYTFADEEYGRKFASEEQIGQLASVFALLAIFISCLGLFGMASFVAEQRTKEIGIRKVLGASSLKLSVLLSKDFLKLVMLAVVIASPIAWWSMNQWLQAFPYRVSVTWWMFALAGISALLIALATVSYQAIRAAWANPVKSLRSE